MRTVGANLIGGPANGTAVRAGLWGASQGGWLVAQPVLILTVDVPQPAMPGIAVPPPTLAMTLRYIRRHQVRFADTPETTQKLVDFSIPYDFAGRVA